MKMSFNVQQRLFSGFLTLIILSGASLEASAQNKRLTVKNVPQIKKGLLKLCPEQTYLTTQKRTGRLISYSAKSRNETIAVATLDTLINRRIKARKIPKKLQDSRDDERLILEITARLNNTKKVKTTIIDVQLVRESVVGGITKNGAVTAPLSPDTGKITVVVLPANHKDCRPILLKPLPQNKNKIRNPGVPLQKPGVIRQNRKQPIVQPPN